MPKLTGLLETSLYVDDMKIAVEFFERVLQLRPMLRGERLTAFDAGSAGVLLLFKRGASATDMPTPIGVIPGHDGSGALHIAFAIAAEAYAAWCEHLGAQGVPLVSQVRWPRGGRSVYFHDPDGHLLELATPGLWDNY